MQFEDDRKEYEEWKRAQTEAPEKCWSQKKHVLVQVSRITEWSINSNDK